MYQRSQPGKQERERQRRKAKSYADNLLHNEILIPHHKSLQTNSFTINPLSILRHDKRAKNRGAEKKGVRSRSAYGDSASSPFGLSQSSFDEDEIELQAGTIKVDSLRE